MRAWGIGDPHFQLLPDAARVHGRVVERGEALIHLAANKKEYKGQRGARTGGTTRWG